MPQLKVLISGAGVAGSALAFWLSKLGHNITVIERFPSLRTSGLQLDLRGHGIEVLKRMGLEQAFRSKAAPEQGIQIVDKSGRRRAYFPANRSGKGVQSFTTEYEIMRGDLCQLLYDVSKDRTKFIFNQWIESFTEQEDSIEVRFADGTIEKFDLVVGADGQGSRTRKMMHGSDTDDAFCPLGGMYVGYFTITQPIQKGEEYLATLYMAPGNRGIMTRRHHPDQLQVYIGGKSSSDLFAKAYQAGVDKEKKALEELFQGAGWRTEEIIRGMHDSENFYLEHMGLVKLDCWSRGCVVLLGDAAYCPSAMTGMGTTSAFVGAYILAGEIGEHCGSGNASEGHIKHALMTALQAYEVKFRPFMNQVQNGVSEGRGSMMPSSAFGIAVFNYLAGIVSLLKLNFIGKWFFKEKIKDWDLPEYEEMLEDGRVEAGESKVEDWGYSRPVVSPTTFKRSD